MFQSFIYKFIFRTLHLCIYHHYTDRFPIIYLYDVFYTLFIIYANPITHYRKVHNLSSTRIFFLRTYPFHYSCLDWLNSNKKKNKNKKNYCDLGETFRIPFVELGDCCYNYRNNLPFYRTPLFPRPINYLLGTYIIVLLRWYCPDWEWLQRKISKLFPSNTPTNTNVCGDD